MLFYFLKNRLIDKMYKSSRLYIFFLLPITGNILLIDESVATLDFLQQTLELSPPEFHLFKKSAVQPCLRYEKSLEFKRIINEILNSEIFKFSPPTPKILPCKDTTAIAAKFLGHSTCENKCGEFSMPNYLFLKN